MASERSRYYSVNATGGSLFGVPESDGKGDVGTRDTHFSFQRVNFWIDSGNFVSFQSSDYSSKSNYNKYSYYYSLSWRRYDKYSTASYCRGGVGPRTNNFSY